MQSEAAAAERPDRDHYPPDATAGEARRIYFGRYGLGDGGYEDEWVHAKIGFIPVVIPNTASRKRQIPAHDMHHVITGCNAVWNQGEIDVSAYELRSGGCGTFLMGWWIVLNFFALGLLIRPRRLFDTFVRARGSSNMFGSDVDDAILALTVTELREFVAFRDQPRRPERRDYVLFGLTSLAALLDGLLTVGVVVGLGWLLWMLVT